MHLRFDWLKDHNNPRSVSGRFRANRWQRFCSAFPDLEHLDVLDVGGRATHWIGRTPQPRSITVTNLPNESPQGEYPANIRCISWTTFEAPPEVLLDRQYGLVHSNSVIEHVGDAAARARFAKVISGLAPRLWIQTPNRYFPIEPHWMFPFFQFLPSGWKVAISRYWPLSYGGTTEAQVAQDRIDSVELIGASELKGLFPDAVIVRERFLGLTKSLIASQSLPGRES